MKAPLAIVLLASLVLTKSDKIQVHLQDQPNQQPISKKELPEDIKTANEFLQQSQKDFEQVKQQSAAQAMQNNLLNQSIDLTIPKLENDVSSENLVPVRQLENEDEDKEDSDDGEEDKLDDVEKRLFSIEDKIDHLLLHAGHEVSGHHAIMTPWGTHFGPSDHNPNSMHHKLRMVDYMFGRHPGMGMGMGMGTGMGMGAMGMGAMGMGMGAMGMGMGHHMMGLGHGNPIGVGLDHYHAMKYGMYPNHLLHPLHPMHTFAPYGMHPYNYSALGYHPIYGHLGYGMMSHSRYRDDLEEERHQRYMRHQRDMDEIMNKPLIPPSYEKPPEKSSSLFLI